jgi:hypothetical protein
MLALTAPCAFVSPLSYIDKDVKMNQSVKKGLIAVGVLAVGAVSNASAALTASDVSMATATADVTTVVTAIIGLLVVIFGFKKVIGILSKLSIMWRISTLNIISISLFTLVCVQVR